MSDNQTQPTNQAMSQIVKAANDFYANAFAISYTVLDMVFTFGRGREEGQMAPIGSIIVSPQTAKQFSLVLEDNIKKYESSYGEINKTEAVSENTKAQNDFYANAFAVYYSVPDLILTFGRSAGVNQIIPMGTVIMSPQTAKQFSLALAEKIKGYEESFGQINKIETKPRIVN